MTQSKKSLLANLIIIVISTANGYAPPARLASLDPLVGQFVRSIRELPKEKISLQTDLSVYQAGEIVLFQGFSPDAQSIKISFQSKFLFADLRDEYYHPVSQVVLDIPHQQMEGSFSLPAIKT